VHLRLGVRHVSPLNGLGGVVTCVTALQRYGTVDSLGISIADLDEPLLGALLLCAVGAVTSAVASSAAILGALIPLAVPFLVQGELGVTAVVVALAVSATVVEGRPAPRLPHDDRLGRAHGGERSDRHVPCVHRAVQLTGRA
jgi:hypothetical protein